MEGIGLAQERRLRSRKRSDKTEAEKWAEVWAICFPEEQEVPSPCKLLEYKLDGLNTRS